MITELLGFTTMDLAYYFFKRLLRLDRELLRELVSFQDQRSEMTMKHGPEVDIFGDSFLACHSFNLSHTICIQQIGKMGSFENKSFK